MQEDVDVFAIDSARVSESTGYLWGQVEELRS